MDIWIGDRVKLKSGKVGVFQGTNKLGKARVLSAGKIILSPIKSLQILEDIEEEDDLDWIEEPKVVPKAKPGKFTPILDLHLASLDPQNKRRKPQGPLALQLADCTSFLKKAIDHKAIEVTIIHGKGEGILKKEVEHLIKDYKQVKFTQTINDGGAILVYFGP